jgi:transposase-like protein
MGKKKSYTPAPTVPDEVIQRLQAVMEVLAGVKSVSEAARSLNLSRNHFQTLLNRGVSDLIEAISPHPAGRPPKPEKVADLEVEVAKLRRENAQLQQRVGSTDRLLEVASGLLHGRIRARSPKKKTTENPGEEDPEPERVLAGVEEMRQLGLSAPLAAAVAGWHPATLRRWRARERNGLPLLQRTARRLVQVAPEMAARAGSIVRALNGLVGAESLRHCVAGISRRQAARVKAQTLTAMERERKSALTRVTVAAPGILRGMDGVHFHSADGPLWALFCADGATPFRTSVKTGVHYDAALVADALSADIEKNGAPIVYRFDRAAAHDAPAARAVLEANDVLVLHGPPRYPRFYGQHERQNREHRAWAGKLASLRHADIIPCLLEMLTSVNELWRRRTLGWKTASELWNERPKLMVDRRALREEVKDRASRIARELERRGGPADLAERLAIEQTLELKGYLRKEVGGWC